MIRLTSECGCSMAYVDDKVDHKLCRAHGGKQKALRNRAEMTLLALDAARTVNDPERRLNLTVAIVHDAEKLSNMILGKG